MSNARDFVCDGVPCRRQVAGLLLLSAVAGEPAVFVGPLGCGQRGLVSRLSKALYGDGARQSVVNATKGGAMRLQLAAMKLADAANEEEDEGAPGEKPLVFFVEGGGERGGERGGGRRGEGEGW